MTRRLLSACLAAGAFGTALALPARAADPPPLPAYLTHTEPAEPRLPGFLGQLSPTARQTAVSSLLFSIHPLLLLAPTEQYLDLPSDHPVPPADRDVVPGAPTVMEDTGQMMFLIGLQGHIMKDSTLCSDAGDSATGAPVPPGVSSCPWLSRPVVDRHAQTLADPDVTRTVQQNLERLVEADRLMDEAKELGRQGYFDLALDCFDLVRLLCPGSSYEERVCEALADLFANGYGASSEDTANDEEADCKSWWERLSDAVHSLLPINFYSTDPNWRIVEYIELSKDGSRAEHKWKRFRVVDQPSSLQPQRITPPPEAPAEGREEAVLRSVLEGVIQCAGPDLGKGLTIQYDRTNCTLTVTGTRAVQQAVADRLAALRHSMAAKTPAPAEEPLPSACPKCEEMHARVMAGVEQQVTGLMKACRLEMEAGQPERAAELARQAFALDRDRVAADPLVYKMHLLADRTAGGARSEPSCPHCPAAASEEAEPSAGVKAAAAEGLRQLIERLEDCSLSLLPGGCVEFGVGRRGLEVSCQVPWNGSIYHLAWDGSDVRTWVTPGADGESSEE